MPQNPFRPTFGVSPVVVAGRKATLFHIETGLLEGIGSAYRFTIVSGLRGSGKTVFLNQAEELAQQHGWEVVNVPVAGNMIDSLVASELPELLNRLKGGKRRWSIEAVEINQIGSISFSDDKEHQGFPTLRSLLVEACEILTARGAGLLLSLDELQAAHPSYLHHLSEAIQLAARKKLNIAFCFAGLPEEINTLLDHSGTTFLRRAIPIVLEKLSPEDVASTLQETARSGGKAFSESALALATSLCDGYAYLIQLIGSLAWTYSTDNTINEETVASIKAHAIDRMGAQVHTPALRAVPDRELAVLVAMAQQDGPAVISRIVELTGIPSNQVSTYRRRLIDRGLIEPKGHGIVDFTMPHMGAHIRNNLHRYAG